MATISSKLSSWFIGAPFGENRIAADYMLSSVSAHVEYLISRERSRPDWSRRLSAFWSSDAATDDVRGGTAA
jgi:hypothetical protein